VPLVHWYHEIQTLSADRSIEAMNVTAKSALVLLLTVALTACRPTPAKVLLFSSVHDNDCYPEANRDCRLVERSLVFEFTAAFSSDAACKGLWLKYIDPTDLTAEGAGPYLERGTLLVMEIDRDPEVWSWRMVAVADPPHHLQGRSGSASEVARSVCNIMKETGGTVQFHREDK
jgi:hypothetical protein